MPVTVSDPGGPPKGEREGSEIPEGGRPPMFFVYFSPGEMVFEAEHRPVKQRAVDPLLENSASALNPNRTCALFGTRSHNRRRIEHLGNVRLSKKSGDTV